LLGIGLPGVGADEADAIAACNLAMLNDFDGMSQEEMMACAEKLESPLKRLEEETKAKEAAEREAAEKAKAEAEAKAAAAAAEAAKRKQAEDAAAAALLRQKKRATGHGWDPGIRPQDVQDPNGQRCCKG
jgi:hypothetical protein